jgi:hypothetical protein
MLDEGIDPRKARIVKRAGARTESPLPHSPVPVSRAISTQLAIGTPALSLANGGMKRPTDLSDYPDDIPKDKHSVLFLAHEFSPTSGQGAQAKTPGVREMRAQCRCAAAME